MAAMAVTLIETVVADVVVGWHAGDDSGAGAKDSASDMPAHLE